MAPPKAVLFDIGGVCVLSPMQAIADYEKKHSIPNDWINYAISRAAPNGSWQRLERGEIKLDADFFKGFNADFQNPEVWKDYHTSFRSDRNKRNGIANPTHLGGPVSLKADTAESSPTVQGRELKSSASPNKGPPSQHKTLKDLAKENPTQLGDPVSLKAETANSSPTDQDRGAKSPAPQSEEPSSQHKSLKELAKENPTQLGDPVSLKAETADSTPTDNDRGAQSTKLQSHETSSNNPRNAQKPPTLKQLAQRNPSQLGDPVSLKAETSNTSPTPQDAGASSIPPTPTNIPSSTLPPIDAESLFWLMMSASQSLDPHITPALLNLSTHKPTFILGALSNTITFPSSHPYALRSPSRQNIFSAFDIFVASAEVGCRKPDPKIYEIAIERLDQFDRNRGGNGINARDVFFLDDIGENLRAASRMGMRTIRVKLGETWKAVEELERAVGVKLREGKAKL